MKFFPLIALSSIFVIMVLTVLVVMDLQSKNPVKIDVTRQPAEEIVVLEEEIEKIKSCPDSVTEIRTIFHCGAITDKRNFELVSVKGMEKCMRENKEYYTMQPGQSASVTYELYRGFDFNDPPRSPSQIQIIRDPHFLHQYETPQGSTREEFYPQEIQVLFDSDKTLLGYDEFATITAMISVDENAEQKTMLLGLTPYTCNGGTYLPFAIVG